MFLQGSLTFTLNQNIKMVYLLDVLSLQKVLEFVEAIQPYSKAAISQAAYTEFEILDNEESEGDIPDVNFYAVIKMRRSSDNKLVGWPLPAPDFDIFEEVENKGYRVSESVGETLTAAYVALSGVEHTFEKGWLCGGSGA